MVSPLTSCARSYDRGRIRAEGTAPFEEVTWISTVPWKSRLATEELRTTPEPVFSLMVFVRTRSTGTDCHAPPGVRALTEKLVLRGSPVGTGYTTSRSAASGPSSALAVPVATPSREYAAAGTGGLEEGAPGQTGALAVGHEQHPYVQGELKIFPGDRARGCAGCTENRPRNNRFLPADEAELVPDRKVRQGP